MIRAILCLAFLCSVLFLSSQANSASLYGEMGFSSRDYEVMEGQWLEAQYEDQSISFEIGIQTGTSYNKPNMYAGVGIEDANFNDSVYITSGLIRSVTYDNSLQYGIDGSLVSYDDEDSVSIGVRVSPFFIVDNRIVFGMSYERINIDEGDFWATAFGFSFGIRTGL